MGMQHGLNLLLIQGKPRKMVFSAVLVQEGKFGAIHVMERTTFQEIAPIKQHRVIGEMVQIIRKTRLCHY